MSNPEINLELTRRAASGDTAALTQLLEVHGPAVRRKIGPKIAARWRPLVSVDDVMQETYTDVFLSIGEFTPLHDGSFARWLHSVAIHNLQNALRMLRAQKRGGHRTRLEPKDRDEGYQTLLAMIDATSTTPSRLTRRREVCQQLENAISMLPPDHAHVVRLYDLEGQSVEQVSAALGQSAGAVFMLRARAHRKLRSFLGASGMLSSS